MKVTFLGTGTSQGIPVIGNDHPVCQSKNPKDKRMRSSVLITDNNFQVVIDCGPDFRMQMLNNNVKHIDGIIFTHEHSDHIAGLDDIRQFSLRQGDIPIYAQKRVLDALIQRYQYIFNENIIYRGKAKAKAIEIFPKQNFKIKNKNILPIPIMHGKLPILGYKIDSFAYLTDISHIDQTAKQLLLNLNTIVVDTLRIEPHPTHFNLQQALELIEQLNPKQAYLTHISHNLGFHDQVQQSLPNNIYLSYDGLTINL